MLRLIRVRRVISLAIAVLLLVGAFGMKAFATEFSTMRIPKNTPVIDGEIDAIYAADALRMPLDTVGEGCSITRAISYLFWDDEYLYCCAVTYADATERSAVGFFFRDDAYQSILISADGEFIACTKEEDATFSLEETKFAAKSYDGYYVVEIAIALNSIHAGRVIGFHTCYYELYDEQVYSYGGLFFWNNLVFSSNAQTDSPVQSDVPATSSVPSADSTEQTDEPDTSSPDENQDDGGNAKSGCSSAMSAPVTVGIVLAVTAAAVVVPRRARKRTYRD